MDYNGLAAIVSGGASGLGLATAKQLQQAGAKVSVLDRNELREPGIESFCCDVTDEANVTEALEAAEQRHGVCRILVNCAGVAPAKRVVGKNGVMPLADFQQVININLIGTFNLVRLVSANLSQAEVLNNDGERGVIINTASIAATDGQVGQAAYAASKAGVQGMTLPLARELARFGIRVVTIAPGIFNTPMMAAMPEKVQSSLAQSIPFPQRFGEPEEFAKLACHVVENSMLNGEIIRLDGAVRMGA